MKLTGSSQFETFVPVRIDLAGGTLDLWPIYLLVDHAMTINVGINLYARTSLEESEQDQGEKITLRSIDQDSEIDLKLSDFLIGGQTGGREHREIFQAKHPSLILHYLILRHALLQSSALQERLRKRNLVLSTEATSPAGAGLGGSSALSVSIAGAVHAWAEGKNTLESKKDRRRIIELVKDLESQVLLGPAGLQDYYGAAFGGLQKLTWLAGQHTQEWYPDSTLDALESRLLVYFSGKHRNSGINNWSLYKDFIDQKSDVPARFQAIANSTLKLDQALLERNWQMAGQAIAEEWQTRRTLAPSISTEEIDQAFSVASQHGVDSYKICGAGGGGCFFVFVPNANENLKNRIDSDILKIEGVRKLPIQTVPGGLELKVKHD